MSRDRSQGGQRGHHDSLLAHPSLHGDAAAPLALLHGRANDGDVNADDNGNGHDDRLIEASRNGLAIAAYRAPRANDQVDDAVDNADLIV